MNFPNYQQHKDSPQVSDEEYGIKIIFPENQRKITYKIDEVWPLYGVYSVNWELIEKFKGDIDSQVVIIVIDKVFKTVYFGRIIKEDLPVETEEIEEPTGGRVVSVQGYFNIDLKTQCRLPIQAGEYWVMAILPPMSSEILEIKILDQDKE